MENQDYNKRANPLSDLISDDIYELLNSRGLFDETSVRDRLIRRKFRMMRDQKLSVGEAIDNLLTEYPYLQFDTIKKIVHHPPKKKKNFRYSS
ncbi:MAG: hypothetical protein EHM47_18730 [Ignavibacteriales bacterium]|nr:MAG: hypothetical protein EHM47_18730 [Ignavibacteriales bacterium]